MQLARFFGGSYCNTQMSGRGQDKRKGGQNQKDKKDGDERKNQSQRVSASNEPTPVESDSVVKQPKRAHNRHVDGRAAVEKHERESHQVMKTSTNADPFSQFHPQAVEHVPMGIDSIDLWVDVNGECTTLRLDDVRYASNHTNSLS
ncbi:hypothetical protein BBJ28_00025742 [Nothophytophthora sp. Chile5]|nr:hypothetical protein BBJ28_00025742 [Nothophytophthora sp. Chile5]